MFVELSWLILYVEDGRQDRLQSSRKQNNEVFEQVSNLKLMQINQSYDWRVFLIWMKCCFSKFDCEWGNGMGPQGLGMVPWELPSGLLTPTVPWVQWYWTFTGLRWV